MLRFRDWIYIGIIVLFGLFGMRALFHSGFYTSLDGWHNIARLYHYHQAIADGQFPPRWIGSLASGYGYPLFIFSYHAPWLMAEPFVAMGADVFTAIKVVLTIGFMGSGLFMYLWLREVFAKEGALVAAITYMWAPYRFSKIFVGASVGEATVFLFLPLLWWGMWRVFKDQASSGIIIGSIGLAGMILSHFMIIPLAVPFLVLNLIYMYLTAVKRFAFIKKSGLLGLLGLGLTAFYWLPLLTYSNLIQAKTASAGFASLYRDHFVNFSQLIYSRWGYGPIVHSAKDGEISFQLGVAQWLGSIAILGLAILAWLKVKIPKPLSISLDKEKKGFMLICLVSLGLSLFFMLDLSTPVWDAVKQLAPIDYPWRFLALATFFAAILTGRFVSAVKKYSLALVFFFMLIAIYTNRHHLQVNQYTDIPLAVYVDAEKTTNTFAEYLPRWAGVDINKKPPTIVAANDDVSVDHLVRNSWMMTFQANTSKATRLTFNHLYFPGQTVSIDGKRVSSTYDGEGRIVTDLTAGNHEVKVIYEKTTLMKVADAISLICLLILFGLSFTLFRLRRIMLKAG